MTLPLTRVAAPTRNPAGCDKILMFPFLSDGGLTFVPDAAPTLVSPTNRLQLPYDRERLEDVGFMTCMTLVLLGNYAQTGHFGGPLAYTPYNVATHLAGPELGGLRFDYRRPKHPYSDKFMLAGGHCIPTCYALWMIMGQAMERKPRGHGRRALLRRSRRWRCCRSTRWASAAAPARWRRCCRTTGSPTIRCSRRPSCAASRRWPATPRASTSPTTSTAARRASASPRPRARPRSGTWSAPASAAPKIIAFEGEFAMTEGHAQELKTQALALKVGKRLRVMISDNNAGIDDSLIGGVIDAKFAGYNLVEQWTSYGWNVFTVANGNDYEQVVAALQGARATRIPRTAGRWRSSARR